MAPKRKIADASWRMSDEQRALIPEITGNEINGLGEAQIRRPNIVYWPNDSQRAPGTEIPQVSKHPYGPVINWFRKQSAPPVRDAYMDFENRAPRALNELSTKTITDTPENWTRKVKEFVLADEGKLVGITALKSEWFYGNEDPVGLPWVVVIGAPMNYEKMLHVPPTIEDPQASVEVGEIYNKVDRAAGKLANWIRSQGWDAENQGGPNSGKMIMIPAALACGFGELGKHGSIINREYGSLIRLSCVRRCQICTRALHYPCCPTMLIFLVLMIFARNAIEPEKQLVRGDQKWYVNFDKCVPYFNENQGCAICITVCPWSKPGTAPKLAERMTKRKHRRMASTAN